MGKARGKTRCCNDGNGGFLGNAYANGVYLDELQQKQMQFRKIKVMLRFIQSEIKESVV